MIARDRDQSEDTWERHIPEAVDAYLADQRKQPAEVR
jgi:hypothetical protein